MRKILQALMEANGHTGHSLYDLSGVPAATTYRFLSGRHGEPKSSTVRRWARAYNVTEGQLRGTDPIEELDAEKVKEKDLSLESVLTRDELEAIEGMRKLDKTTRRAWLNMGKMLSGNTVEQPKPERKMRVRSKKVDHNPLIGMKYRKHGESSAKIEDGHVNQAKKV